MALGRRVRLQLADPAHPGFLAIQLGLTKKGTIQHYSETISRSDLVHEVGAVRAVDSVVNGREVGQFVGPWVWYIILIQDLLTKIIA